MQNGTRTTPALLNAPLMQLEWSGGPTMPS